MTPSLVAKEDDIILVDIRQPLPSTDVNSSVPNSPKIVVSRCRCRLRRIQNELSGVKSSTATIFSLLAFVVVWYCSCEQEEKRKRHTLCV